MVEFYKTNIDEFDASKNGGAITDDIAEDGVKNNLLADVRSRMAEQGGEKFFKFFIKSTTNIVDVGVAISQLSTSPTEDVYISLQNDDKYESDLDKESMRFYGGFVVDSYDKANKKATATIDVSDFVKADDTVTFYNSDNLKIVSFEVDSVSAKEITFKEVDDTDVASLTGASTVMIDALDTDATAGLWIKQKIGAFTEAMEQNLDNFTLNVWYDKK